MGYSLKPSEDRDYIVLTVVGEINGQSMMKYIIEAHDLGKEMGINRYFVDVTEARNIDSILGNYNFAYSDMKKSKGVDTLARVAALVSPGDHSHDFIETVLTNAGLSLKLFTNPVTAREYLRKK